MTSVTGVGGYLGTRTQCYGFLHRPEGPTNQGVVIVNDFGYRGLCAYWALRRLADRLASEGATVLRFDLPGTGDSPAIEDDRVAQWGPSVEEAIDFLRSQAGIEEVLVIGYGLGAALGLNAAALRPVVKAIELIDPRWRGAVAVAETASAPLAGGQLVSDHFLTNAEVTSLTALRAELTPRSPPLDLTAVTFDEAAGRDLAQAAERAGVTVNVIASTEGPRLLKDPLYSQEVPEFFDGIVERLRRRRAAPLAVGLARLRARIECPEHGYDEEAIANVEADGAVQHGVLAVPRSTASPHALVVIFGTSANRRTGMHNNNTAWARALASAGIATLRFDASGIGDSRPRAGAPDNDSLRNLTVSDATAFLGELRQRGFTELGAMGLSSGGFNAFQFALRDHAVLGLLGLNTARFVSESLEDFERANIKTTATYWAALRSPATWTRLLRGRVNARYIARALGERLRRQAQTKLKLVTARLKPAGETVLGQAHREMLELLARPGFQVQLVYSEGDKYIEEFEKHFGPRGAVLARHHDCEVTFLPGMDHSMSAPDAAAKVAALCVRFFTRALATHAGAGGGGGPSVTTAPRRTAARRR
jgi:pimeloyl-ACP methyl ester carboxylesterase